MNIKTCDEGGCEWDDGWDGEIIPKKLGKWLVKEEKKTEMPLEVEG